jgi:hypothetical protein
MTSPLSPPLKREGNLDSRFLSPSPQGRLSPFSRSLPHGMRSTPSCFEGPQDSIGIVSFNWLPSPERGGAGGEV